MIVSSPWKTELFKLFMVLAGTIFLYQIIGQWWLSIAITGSCYIGLLLFKLHEIYQWLSHGMEGRLTPDAGGLCGGIITLIYRYKKTIEDSHNQQKAITRQFHDTMSAIPSATIVLNQSHEIEWANYPALMLLGVNGQRDTGIRIESLLRQEEFISHLNKDINEQFEMTSPVSQHMTLAVQIVKYADRKRLLIAHNITPHIEVQRSRKTFIANASHELRTPLTVVSGYLDFIHSDPDLPDSLIHPVEKAVEQADNMEILINDLLVLSKLEDKDLNPDNINRINLKSHLETIIQTLEAGGKSSEHTIKTTVDKGLFIEAADKELDSVCYNLINNAIKYSERESTIQIQWKRQGDNAIFSVADRGIGIAPQHIRHLTERFYRVDNGRSRRVGGTGLGLSIVKHIIERHNGRLEIHSRLGEGSTFSAIFPIYPLGQSE